MYEISMFSTELRAAESTNSWASQFIYEVWVSTVPGANCPFLR